MDVGKAIVILPRPRSLLVRYREDLLATSPYARLDDEAGSRVVDVFLEPGLTRARRCELLAQVLGRALKPFPTRHLLRHPPLVFVDVASLSERLGEDPERFLRLAALEAGVKRVRFVTSAELPAGWLEGPVVDEATVRRRGRGRRLVGYTWRLSLLAAGAMVFMLLGSPRCTDEAIEVRLSPVRRVQARVVATTCGRARAPTSVWVTPYDEETAAPGERAKVFEADYAGVPERAGEAVPAQLAWLSDRELSIAYDRRARVLLRRASFGGIRIRYTHL